MDMVKSLLMKYSVVINKSEYGFDVHCPALPDCHSQGDTSEEALENIKMPLQYTSG